MLAYVFWHRPLEDVAIEAYERAQIAFHHSLAHAPPAGFLGSACYRAAELPWLGGLAGYEDWYFTEDYTALGVLNEAAVGHGHRSVHDDLARRFGGGAGGLYGLIEGHSPATDGSLGRSTVAVWVGRSPGVRRRSLGELLGDGMDPKHASLWRRQLVLGPAPEFCLLAGERSNLDLPAGVAATRLPEGWTATIVEREALVVGEDFSEPHGRA
ncbi:MAG TPA: hypothetical protein VFC30_00990 [Solirubrobacteraceae bacterium]|nr:hypothetical protein [Solirubrobacteraceae bacterium]